MLSSLEIRDILIIDRLDIAFQPGLNVLTGETGAGKSILLDALGFVLGWRGRADLVRQGAKQGEVTAEFELGPDHPARLVLREADLPEEDTLVLRRTNTPEGRKSARVNDRRVSGEVLRSLSACLVELHGQHDDRGLLDPRGHLVLLDEFAGLTSARSKVSEDFRALGAARRALSKAETALAEAREEEEFLRHAVTELGDFAAEDGEEEQLDLKRRHMQAAEKTRADILRGAELIGESGAEAQLASGLRWLEGAAELLEGQLEASLGAVERAMAELSEAQSGVAQALRDLEFDPYQLEGIEERLFALRALARKHDVPPNALPELGQVLTDRLAALERSDAELVDLKAAVTEARKTYDQSAAALSKKRKAAGARLDKAMKAELTPLKMDRAEFKTVATPIDGGPDGIDAVAFQVATNPGAPAGALEKIASGGELSRFLLALKVCLTAQADGLTLIFDEIDRGVGGATADAVGRRLAALAKGGESQILVVTHSPQVAALGDHHWRVEKSVKAGQTRSRVVPLPEPERVDEIARMLAGDQVTDAARAAATALLTGKSA